jgi:hypothetical protein
MFQVLKKAISLWYLNLVKNSQVVDNTGLSLIHFLAHFGNPGQFWVISARYEGFCAETG